MLPQQWTGIMGDRVIRVKSSKAVPVFMYVCSNVGGSFVAFYKGNFRTPELMFKRLPLEVSKSTV